MTRTIRPPARPRPVVLCVLDGWGDGPGGAHDAIAAARKPIWDRLLATCPHARIDASEVHVGLPEGQMGNSEVGHMNLGAGRVVMQDLPRIDRAVADGSLGRNPVLIDVIARLRASGGTCHLLGLLSPGGVHSHQVHLAALARTVADAGVLVAVHAVLDGRDTPPRSARDFLARFLADVPSGVRIATVSGRYYAMDRDRRWERVTRAYRAIVAADGERAPDADAAITHGYARGTGDEFVPPTVIAGYQGAADGDGLLMANFRADRAREILTALLDPDFADFPRARRVAWATAAGLTEYSTDLNRHMGTLFAPIPLRRILGELVSEQGLRQLRIAETEKYAHVTFFFNGGEERPFPGEDRILVPSPKVATYDLKPEMSAFEVTDRLTDAIRRGTYDVIVVNFANADMVGHTGNQAAAIKAIEAVDTCLGHLAAALDAAGGAMLITADHGNAEQMFDAATGQPHTAHTANRVPAILVGGPEGATLHDGRLADVAPTLLALLGLAKPAEMTGQSLVGQTRRGARQAHG
ncbi:MAG: 2,3-bisphosphoglycerate-independent phosphoglycerate mutase [Alphaproteobacteria bacterium]|nr:2,3-bisphosphoglycerate-independent phosphoglycerate mutase [Alphaproteobacteria bacterium]